MDFESLTPEDFPRWKDPACPHPEDRQEPDGTGKVCMDCGIIQWR